MNEKLEYEILVAIHTRGRYNCEDYSSTYSVNIMNITWLLQLT